MIFSYHSLCDVTDNFSNDKLVGKGGFGRVYRGKLRHIDVAIKVPNTVSYGQLYDLDLTVLC